MSLLKLVSAWCKLSKFSESKDPTASLRLLKSLAGTGYYSLNKHIVSIYRQKFAPLAICPNEGLHTYCSTNF